MANNAKLLAIFLTVSLDSDDDTVRLPYWNFLYLKRVELYRIYKIFRKRQNEELLQLGQIL
jgi:hypothetical protein